jgi:predicted ATPase/DNA-binding CsgD family transcriptional regulator
VLPAPLTSFVGRVDELAALTAAVARFRLVTVVGPGGCGKSRLAVEAARGADPLLGFVELFSAGVDSSLAAFLLAGCGLRDDPGLAPRDQLVEHLQARPGLLVLDNCEHVRAKVAALLEELLPRCPRLHVLATSRVGLGLVGEATVSLGGLNTDDAVALFVDRARLVQPTLALDEPEREIIAEICGLADGLPLAVELAAAHARALSVAAIRHGMADRLRFLADRDADEVAPRRSLAASLDRSAELVGEAARTALAALSVVNGRFPLDVALAVIAGERETLEALVDHSLVQFDAADGRYLLLDTVRAYAAAALTASGAAEEVGGRLLDWAVAFACEVRAGLERADPQALRRADACDAAVAAALQWGVAVGRGDDAAAVAADLAFAWSLRGRCAEGIAQVQRLTAALDPVPPPLRWAHAFLAAYGGEMESGFVLATVAANDAAAAGDDRSRARALTLQGLVLQWADPVAAAALVTEAAALAERVGDDWCRVESLQMLAYTHLLRAELPAALAAAEAAVPTLQRLGHAQLQAWDAAIRTEVATGQGRFAEAETCGREGLRLAVAVGEPISALGSLLPLLRTLLATGRTREAQTVLDQHRGFFATHPGMVTTESMTLAATVIAAEANPDTAAAAAQAALEQARAIDLAWYAAEAADLLALARLRRGDADDAREAAHEAASWAERLGHRGLACRAAFTAGAAERMRGGHPADAADAVHAALAEAARLGLRPLVVDGLEIVAALAADLGRGVVAARLQGAAERLRAELGAVPSPLVRVLDFSSANELARMDGRGLGWEAAVSLAARSRGRRSRPRAGWESLTPTEREVVALAARGLSNAAIGAQLLITAGTVRTHLRSVFGKLGIASRAELAAQAARRGL